MVDGVKCSSQVEQAQGRNKSTVSCHEEIIVHFRDSRLSAVVLTVCADCCLGINSLLSRKAISLLNVPDVLLLSQPGSPELDRP